MSDKRLFTLNSEAVRARIISFIALLPLDGCSILYSEKRRTLDQNAKLWPMLKDVSEKVCWHGKWLAPTEWKDVFTGSLDEEVKIVPNIQGTGFISLGKSTSQMPAKEFSLLIEFMYCFGAEHGVVWSERSLEKFCELRRAA